MNITNKDLPFDGVQHVENVSLLDYSCEQQSTKEDKRGGNIKVKMIFIINHV